MSRPQCINTELVNKSLSDDELLARLVQASVSCGRQTMRDVDIRNSLTADEKTTLLHEYDSACEEYRYRDELLVQEFYFGVATMGVLASVIKDLHPNVFHVMASVATAILLFILSVHLGHLIVDRNLMWERAQNIEKSLGIHVKRIIWDTSYRKGARKKRILSGTRLMLWSTQLFACAWILYAGYVIYLTY